MNALAKAFVAWAALMAMGTALAVTTEPKSLAALSNEELIGQLQTAGLQEHQSSPPGQIPRLVVLGAPVNIGPSRNPIFVDCPAMAELVRRGVKALPALLGHVSDERPTGIVLGLDPREGTRRRPVVVSDEFDILPALKGRDS